MYRTRISRSLTIIKYVLVGVMTLLIPFLWIYHNDPSKIWIPSVFLIISGTLFYAVSKAKIVEFDDTNMFVSDNKTTDTIPLANIDAMKLTMMQLNRRNFWKIKYTDTNGIKRAVRILPCRKEFEVFKTAVKGENPSVKIQNWSHSFDLDQ